MKQGIDIDDFIKIITPTRILYVAEWSLSTKINPIYECKKDKNCRLLFGDKKLFTLFFSESQYEEIVKEKALVQCRVIKNISLPDFENEQWRKYNWIVKI